MIIGLTGYAGSGKSTAARHLVEQHGVTLLKFAGPLKAMLRALGLGDREIEGDLKEQPCALLGGETPRWAMQTLGTEWGRMIMHPDFWVRIAVENAHRVLDQGGRVVFDDCRFPNEAKAIRDAGGKILRIERQGVGPQSGHASETTLPTADLTVWNYGDMEALKRLMDRAITEKEPCE